MKEINLIRNFNNQDISQLKQFFNQFKNILTKFVSRSKQFTKDLQNIDTTKCNQRTFIENTIEYYGNMTDRDTQFKPDSVCSKVDKTNINYKYIIGKTMDGMSI